MPWHKLCQWSAKENHCHRRLFANSIYLPENLIPKLCSRAGVSNWRKQNYKTAARSGRLAAADITQHCWRIVRKTFSTVWLQNWWNTFRVSRLKNWFIFVDRRGFVELHQGYSTLFSITNLTLTTQKQGNPVFLLAAITHREKAKQLHNSASMFVSTHSRDFSESPNDSRQMHVGYKAAQNYQWGGQTHNSTPLIRCARATPA